jgi:hypothetical protein
LKSGYLLALSFSQTFSLKSLIMFSSFGSHISIFLSNLDKTGRSIAFNLLVVKNTKIFFNEFSFIQSISCNITEIIHSLCVFVSDLFSNNQSASSKNNITFLPLLAKVFAFVKTFCIFFSLFHTRLLNISVGFITMNSASISLDICFAKSVFQVHAGQCNTIHFGILTQKSI